MKIGNVDDNCRTMKRERNFKVYLNNPSMRAALFAPVAYDDHEQIGHLAESAIFSQWQHALGFRNLRYARWKNEGEVDIVYLAERPHWIGEIKWSDKIAGHPMHELRHMRVLLQNHKTIITGFFTTKSISNHLVVESRTIEVIPSALYCYTIGRNVSMQLDAVRLAMANEQPST